MRRLRTGEGGAAGRCGGAGVETDAGLGSFAGSAVAEEGYRELRRGDVVTGVAPFEARFTKAFNGGEMNEPRSALGERGPTFAVAQSARLAVVERLHGDS